MRKIGVDHNKRTNGAIARVSGHKELSTFIKEFICVWWALILLDMTYQFVAHKIVKRGEPPRPIPELRYTRAMVAIIQGDSEKAFIMEELIYSDDGEGEPQFRKYIDNRTPKSLLNIWDPAKAHDITYFLLFSQHFQWQKTHVGAFVLDYQGASGLLTDLQITSNPYILHMHASNCLSDIFWPLGFMATSSVRAISKKPLLNFAQLTSATTFAISSA